MELVVSVVNISVNRKWIYFVVLYKVFYNLIVFDFSSPSRLLIQQYEMSYTDEKVSISYVCVLCTLNRSVGNVVSLQRCLSKFQNFSG